MTEKPKFPEPIYEDDARVPKKDWRRPRKKYVEGDFGTYEFDDHPLMKNGT